MCDDEVAALVVDNGVFFTAEIINLVCVSIRNQLRATIFFYLEK